MDLCVHFGKPALLFLYLPYICVVVFQINIFQFNSIQFLIILLHCSSHVTGSVRVRFVCSDQYPRPLSISFAFPVSYSSNLRERGHSFHFPDYDTVLFKKSFVLRSVGLYKFVASNY